MAKPKKSSRKPVKKKTAPKKAAKKKVAPRKTVAKKPAPKKTAAKKPAPKKPAAKKPAPKKAAPKETVAKKPALKKAAPSIPSAHSMKKAALAKKVARDVASSVHAEPRAFIEGKITTDALAEELGEDTVLAITTGEDEQGERDGEEVAAVGGPFVVSSIVD